jgi:hypothetical protein
MASIPLALPANLSVLVPIGLKAATGEILQGPLAKGRLRTP